LTVLLVNMSVDMVTGGGTAARTMNIAQSIQDDFNKECIVLATDQGLKEGGVSEYSEVNLILLHSIINRFYIPYFSFLQLSKLVKKSEIIHLMSHWTIINVIVYFMARFYNKPYTFCPAGTLKIFGRSAMLKKIYNYIIGKKIIKNAFMCIVITEKERADFNDFKINYNKMIVIPNGISPYEFYPNSAASKLFVKKFNLENIEYLLFMGRLNKIKGPDLLLKTFIKLSSEFKKLHVVFAGPDEGMKKDLTDEAKKNFLSDRVHIIGHIAGDYKVGAYCGAKLLVIPSRREAMSIVALEAGACGTPVLLTTECGFDEVKEVGCEVVTPSVDELHKGVQRMLKSKKLDYIGDELRQKIAAKYTWKNTASMYLKINRKTK
jgi:glycosyltransferase involved in cell wall biosynthesis